MDDTPRDAADALRTDLSPIVAACVRADADAFVAVGDRFDDDLRYLTRFSGPDRDFALVVVPAGADDPGDRAVLCAPSLFDGQARREFVASARVGDRDPDAAGATADTAADATADPAADATTDTAAVDFHDGVAREVRSANVGDPAGERAVAVLDDLRDALHDDVPHDDPRDASVDGSEPAPTVLVPQSIPHDAAVYLERAGYAVVSTAAVSEARAVKTSAEIDRLRRVQRATARGMARAETVLAECTVAESVDGAVGDDVDGPVLVWNGGPLSTERLRRQVNATLAAYGVRDAGNTVIGAGPTAADLHYTGVDVVRPGETVLLDVSPRGPHGYYGDLTRTFVVESDGGWERRAYVAVEAAREAALAEIGPGVTAAAVHREAAAELAAYGFDPNAGEDEPGFTHGTGHGVGVSLHESPSLSSDIELRPGHVVTVEPGVYDPDTGGVRLEDLVAVTDDGYEILSTYPFAMTPARRDV